MTREIEFLVATAKGPIKAKGQVMFFNVDGKRVKFVAHVGPDRSDHTLTHYASGQRIGSIRNVKVSYLRSYKSMTDRAAAQELIEQAIRKNGAERVLQVMESAPVING